MTRFALVLASLFTAFGAAADTGFQLGVPNANLPDDPHVTGVRLSFLHGKNASTRGVDFGVLSLSETSRASGVAFIGGVHLVHDATTGGVIFSLVNVHKGRDTGMNGAFVNVLNDASRAFNVGFVTFAEGATMLDLGGINVSRSSKVQLGFINVTERIDTFQFGFLNMAENGFLPIFPVFNFPMN